MVRGFATLARRMGVQVVLPSGGTVLGLFDRSTKAKGFDRSESQVMTSGPSVVLETVPGLGCGAALTLVPLPGRHSVLSAAGESFEIRDFEAEDDGALTRYHLEIP